MVEHHVFGRRRHHGLSPVRQVAEAGSSVDGRADVVPFVAQLYLTGVQADPQPDRGERCALQFDGTRHRVAGPRESDDEAVTLTLLDGTHTVVRRDELNQCAVERRYSGGHLVRPRLPQPRRTLDVGQQQRHGAGRQVAHAQIAPFGLRHAHQHAVAG